jgi:hypothetical protein
VLEQKSGPQFIFGLDMLKRHQCTINLQLGACASGVCSCQGAGTPACACAGRHTHSHTHTHTHTHTRTHTHTQASCTLTAAMPRCPSCRSTSCPRTSASTWRT